MSISDVCLTVPAGACVALTGSDTAGAGILLELMQRLYDPDMGHVLWDGRDLASFDWRFVNSSVTLVTQAGDSHQTASGL